MCFLEYLCILVDQLHYSYMYEWEHPLFYPLQFTAEELPPTTKATHERHCSGLGGPLQSTIATTYGVKEDSILNTLKYYHITSGLPADIMHHVFEGVAVVEFRCMLSVFVSEMKFFSLATLNRRIRSFPYGYPDVKNKPTPLPVHFLTQHTTAALKQSGMCIHVPFHVHLALSVYELL